MDFLEKNLEDIIFETPNEVLQNRGLYVNGKKRRQVYLGNYGRADLITLDFDIYGPYMITPRFTIFELKQNKIGNNAIIQGVRYAKGLYQYLTNRDFNDGAFSIEIECIGKYMDTTGNDLIYLVDLMNSADMQYGLTRIGLYTYKYNVDGITFKQESGYKLINEGF